MAEESQGTEIGQWVLIWSDTKGKIYSTRRKDVEEALSEEDPDATRKCKRYKMGDGSIIEICI